ncbi:MAG: leucine-rich repeat domain-containing protein [Clostridia bacterium]|nr:leucine-rich repeat domain-containing protein [Clostridia bacterium]
MRRNHLIGKMIGVLVVLLVLFMAAGVADDEWTDEKTDASEKWYYVLRDGGVTITGYVEEPIGDLDIPSELDGHPVTGIGDGAFAECMEIAGVIIPESVTSIGEEAFARCFDLTDVAIPDSVTDISEWAFKDCVSLTGLTIGSNVTNIGGLAFFACESLPEVTIPANVTSIGSLAFADCFSLSSVTIPASVTNISDDAFQVNPELAEFHAKVTLTLRVEKGSYAEQYAQDNNIPYVFALPYKDLSANEILSATVKILPENAKGDLSDDEIKELVAILRTVETSNRDDSYKEYGGQAVIFTLTMTDGTEEIISAFNPFIIINGIGYKTDGCYGLSGLGGTIPWH